MSEQIKKIFASFYRSAGGTEPVRDWLKDMADEDRRIIGFDIATVEFGWPIGMSVCRPLGGGLWEVRSSLLQGRIARVIFCIAEGRMVLLHGFIKKTRKTPPGDLNTAKTRQKEIEE